MQDNHSAKKLCAFFLAVLMVFTVFALPLCALDAPAKSISEDSIPNADVIAASAIYNIENDTFVYEKNSSEVLPTASFTKMMTAACAYELLCDRLDETITVDYSMIKDASGNQVGYYVGETVSFRDLFGGLLVRGANDSAYVLCYAAKGGVDEFVAYMNVKAKSLGMDSTVYKNPTGLSADGMVTTARDSVIVAKEFYSVDFLTSLSSAVKYEMPANNKTAERILYNRNSLVSKIAETKYFDGRITGINAGSTSEAGYYSAAATATEQLSYIIIVMGAAMQDEVNTAYTFTSELATYALSKFGYVDVIKTSSIVCEVPVTLSTDADYVTLVPSGGLTLYLPSSVVPSTDLVYTYRLDRETLEAPVTEGQIVGTYTVSRGGEILGSVDLVTKNSLAKSEFLVVLDRIERFTGSIFFIAAVLSAVGLTLLYFVIRAFVSGSQRRRYGRGRRY